MKQLMHAKEILSRAGFMFVMTTAVIMAHGFARAQGDVDPEVEQPNAIPENALQLPGFPRDDNLQTFYVSPIATATFLIDLSSISIGSDGIIRYTLVAQSSNDARNVTYEGLHCRSFQKKIYAFGRADGTWSVARRGQWAPIRSQAANRQHAALARDYFCQENTFNLSLDAILARLRSKTPATPLGS